MLTRIRASLGLRMKCKTLFMSGEEKHGHYFDLRLFFIMSKQFLAPGGLRSVLSVFKLVSCKPGSILRNLKGRSVLDNFFFEHDPLDATSQKRCHAIKKRGFD